MTNPAPSDFPAMDSVEAIERINASVASEGPEANDIEPSDEANPEHTFDMQAMDDRELIEALRRIPRAQSEKFPRVELTGARGQHCALMQINHPLRVRVLGSLGDYACAWNDETVVKVERNVGHGAGEGMISGSLRVCGDAGLGIGTAMTGGTVAIYGSASHRVGAAMRGGGLFVRGDVGDDVGLGALAGTIVIGGDAGKNLGDPHSNVDVFIRGQSQSLAHGVVEATLWKKQEVKLGLLLISAGIRGSASDFRRVIPQAKLEAEQHNRGELMPNWR